ncbi:CopG family transcriptional regulator [Pseudomonas simiae]|uniref:hypothetical protein n=1 Tax=Pseudomonas simiae TaxID=321846 RepID=UPI00064649D1|nr:hypothetical protein [Pseudomonas simiae]
MPPWGLADLVKTNGETLSDLAMEVLHDDIEHEKTPTAQIELAVKEAELGKFATDDHMATRRVQSWRRHAS